MRVVVEVNDGRTEAFQQRSEIFVHNIFARLGMPKMVYAGRAKQHFESVRGASEEWRTGMIRRRTCAGDQHGLDVAPSQLFPVLVRRNFSATKTKVWMAVSDD